MVDSRNLPMTFDFWAFFFRLYQYIQYILSFLTPNDSQKLPWAETIDFQRGFRWRPWWWTLKRMANHYPWWTGRWAPMQFPLVFANCSMMSRPSRDRSLAGTKPAGCVGCFSPEKDLDVVFWITMTWFGCTAAVWLHQRLLPKASILDCEWSALISETSLTKDYESDSCFEYIIPAAEIMIWLDLVVFPPQKADSIVPRLSVENYCCSLSKARIKLLDFGWQCLRWSCWKKTCDSDFYESKISWGCRFLKKQLL